MSYRILSTTRTAAQIECGNCLSIHTVERDGRGASLDQQPCHDDACRVRLCSECPQFVCDGCRLAHCEAHLIQYSGLKLCRVCMSDMPADECECRYTDVDLADASECRVHGYSE